MSEISDMFSPLDRDMHPLHLLARWADEWTPSSSSDTPGLDGNIVAGDDPSARHARARGWLAG